MRESLRRAVEHGVLVADQATGSFRFRHALLAEAIYATILPGEREELHARLAEELARSGAASPAELAPHWAAAGRSAEALAASVEAARAGGGRLRPGGGSRASRAGARAVARRARRGRARRARPRRALLLDGRARQPDGCRRRARSSSRGERSSSSATTTRSARRSCTSASAEYLHESGSDDAALAAFERAVELVPAEPPSPERAYALAVARGRVDAGLALRRSRLPICRAGARARACASAHARRRSGRSRCSAATSPTSAAATRASPSFGRPCSSPRRSAIPWAWSGRTSTSPTR